MKVTKVDLTLTENEGNVIAYVNFVIDFDFMVRGARVVRNREGKHILLMPSRPNRNGVYNDICFPRNQEARDYIEDLVFGELTKLIPSSVQQLTQQSSLENGTATSTQTSAPAQP